MDRNRAKKMPTKMGKITIPEFKLYEDGNMYARPFTSATQYSNLNTLYSILNTKISILNTKISILISQY